MSFGSDDGIKVYLNGQQVHAHNIGRGAAADQEKLTLKLQKGTNFLLVKIHNQSGPSGFYFNSALGKSVQPVIATKTTAPIGSFTVEIAARSDALRKTKLYWSTKKKKTVSIPSVSLPMSIFRQEKK